MFEQEREDRQTRQQHVPASRVDAVIQRDVPGPLQCDSDVERQAQDGVLLQQADAAACPAHPVLNEVALAIHLLWSVVHKQIHHVSTSVDDCEKEQEHGGADSAVAVVVETEVEVPCEQNRLHDEPQYVEDHVEEGPHWARHAAGPVRRRQLVVAAARHRGRGRRSARELALDHGAVRIRQVGLDHVRLVDRVPLLRGILAQVRHDGLLAARVHRDPLGHVQHLAVDHDPRVLLRVVLSHLGELDAVALGRGGGGGASTAATGAELADDREVGDVLLDHVLLVDHVPLLGGVLSEVRRDGLLSAWVDWDPLGHVDDVAIHHKPGVVLGVVLRDVLEGDRRRAGGRRVRGRRGHGPIDLQVLHLRDQLLLRELLQRLVRWRRLRRRGRIRAQRGVERAEDQLPQVLACRAGALQSQSGGAPACRTARGDALHERHPRDGPHGGLGRRRHLASREKALDRAGGALYLGRGRVGADTPRAGVHSGRHLADEQLAVLIDDVFERLQQRRLLDAHLSGERRDAPGAPRPELPHELVLLVELHHPLQRSGLVGADHQPERAPGPRHPRHRVLLGAPLVAGTAARGVQDGAPRAQDGVRGDQLQGAASVARVHQRRRNEVHVLEAIQLRAHRLGQPNAVAAAALVVCGRQLPEVSPVPVKESLRRLVPAVASRGKHHGT
mmetsp:Transcript_51403/g.133737  ORF Transcript_51403/g.133737 Transcript_51403/m.133737 type:complete len:672 (-) Transcript_51403:293-2308(-)